MIRNTKCHREELMLEKNEMNIAQKTQINFTLTYESRKYSDIVTLIIK